MDGDTGRLSFQLPELSVAASFRRRLPWSEERPNASGPEGWLQKTGLLPLHYFVVSGMVHGAVLGQEKVVGTLAPSRNVVFTGRCCSGIA